MKKVLPALCGRGGLCVDELSIVLGGRGGASLYGERILDRFVVSPVKRRADLYMPLIYRRGGVAFWRD